MSQAGQQGKRRDAVPVCIVLDPSASAVMAPYCQSIISILQSLHAAPLLISPIIPSAHEVPTHPFLPPSSFLATLPSLLRHPVRPPTSIWRSSSGLLRAIKTARKLLQQPIGGVAQGAQKSQGARYVIVISANDLDQGDADEIRLDGEDDEDAQDWQTLASSFTKAPHNTTLFSLVSLTHTPNLESFWQTTASKFPSSLRFNSLTPPPTLPVNFPLFAPTHACFLVGFYNNQKSSTAPPTPQPSTPSALATNPAKRAAPTPDPPPAAANKKAKTAPVAATAAPSSSQTSTPSITPSNPGSATAAGVAQYLNSVQNANPNSTPAVPPRRTDSPNIAAGNQPSQQTLQATNEAMQQYIAEMSKLAAAGRIPNGVTAPQGMNLNDPVARAAFLQAQAQAANLAQSRAQQVRLPGQQQFSPQQALPGQTASASANATGHLSTAQLNSLPQIPPDMKIKIEHAFSDIQARVARGEIKQEEANAQVKRLQDVANAHRFKLQQQVNQNAAGGQHPQGQAQLQAHAQIQALAQAQSQAQAIARQRMASGQSQSSANPPLNYPTQASQNPQQPQQQQPQAQPPATAVWQGPITWTLSEPHAGARKERAVYCVASGLQHNIVQDLAGVTFPNNMRVHHTLPLRMAALQDLQKKHNLPALIIKPIVHEQLPAALRDQLVAYNEGKVNEEMYQMFTQSMDARGDCAIIRFDATPDRGLVLVSAKNPPRFIAVVFTKIPFPEDWNNPDTAAFARMQQDQARLRAQQAQAQAQAQAAVQAPAPAPPPVNPMFSNQQFFNPMNPGLSAPLQQGSMPQLAPQQQQQNNPSMAELERLLGREQLELIMKGT